MHGLQQCISKNSPRRPEERRNKGRANRDNLLSAADFPQLLILRHLIESCQSHESIIAEFKTGITDQAYGLRFISGILPLNEERRLSTMLLQHIHQPCCQRPVW